MLSVIDVFWTSPVSNLWRCKKKQGKIQIVQVIESIWVYSKPLTFFIV